MDIVQKRQDYVFQRLV